jgi:hypothetical protein
VHKIKSTWYGTIEAGKLTLDQEEMFRVWLRGLGKAARKVEVVLQDITRSKTQAQLGYYFASVVPALMDWTGYTKQESDGVLCRLFLTENKGQPNEFVRSKADLTCEEMSEFIDNCVRFLLEHGIFVQPAPTDS